MKRSAKQQIRMLAALCFATVLVYYVLTPDMGDDFTYGLSVRGASFADLFAQEYQQYMNWTGRSVAHMLLRLFIFVGSKHIFNVVAAACFTACTLLIYHLAKREENASPALYLLSVLWLWLFGVDFAQTVLWKTGACNYLFGTTIILFFLHLFRRELLREDEGVVWKRIIPLVLCGFFAGWCNENTSGGMIMIALLWMLLRKKKSMPLLCGTAAAVIGFLLLILAPGNFARSAATLETHTGVAALAARLMQVFTLVSELFFWQICLFLVLVIVIYHLTADKRTLQEPVLFFAAFLATAFAMTAVAQPQTRTMFGAGVFLQIAILQSAVLCKDAMLQAFAGTDKEKEKTSPAKHLIMAASASLLTVLCVAFCFAYVISGAQLVRIRREWDARNAYLMRQAEEGNLRVTAPVIAREFPTKYSPAQGHDIREDANTLSNAQFAMYFGLERVTGVPLGEWDE